MSALAPLPGAKRTFAAMRFMSTRPSTTLAESVCAAAFHGFAFYNTGMAV
jgi:hypothetical protein